LNRLFSATHPQRDLTPEAAAERLRSV